MRSRYATQEGVRDRHLAHHKQQRQMNHEYRERHQKYAAKHYSSFDGRAKTLLKGAYKRDPGATVTLEHIVRMLGLGVCPVTKIPFDISSGFRRGGNGHNNPFAPSLDQIVAKGGYTNANTRLVIWQYNMMKGERTDEELLFICRSIVENAE